MNMRVQGSEVQGSEVQRFGGKQFISFTRGAKVGAMLELMENDILTKVSRYNLIRNQRLIYIDVHERMAGDLAGKFVAVPNLVNIVARQQFQGTGETEVQALQNCLAKIKNHEIEELFPTSAAKKPETTN